MRQNLLTMMFCSFCTWFPWHFGHLWTRWTHSLCSIFQCILGELVLQFFKFMQPFLLLCSGFLMFGGLSRFGRVRIYVLRFWLVWILFRLLLASFFRKVNIARVSFLVSGTSVNCHGGNWMSPAQECVWTWKHVLGEFKGLSFVSALTNLQLHQLATLLKVNFTSSITIMWY